MIEIYKIVSGKYDYQASNFIKLRKDHVQRDQGRGNSRKLLVQIPKLNIRKYSFSVRTANTRVILKIMRVVEYLVNHDT